MYDKSSSFVLISFLINDISSNFLFFAVCDDFLSRVSPLFFFCALALLFDPFFLYEKAKPEGAAVSKLSLPPSIYRLIS